MTVERKKRALGRDQTTSLLMQPDPLVTDILPQEVLVGISRFSH